MKMLAYNHQLMHHQRNKFHRNLQSQNNHSLKNRDLQVIITIIVSKLSKNKKNPRTLERKGLINAVTNA